MMFEMPLYEVRYNDELLWEEISELDLLQRLLEAYDRVAPIIETMIEGKQIRTPSAVYRLKS